MSYLHLISLTSKLIYFSPQNKTGERDAEMHQTRKGNQWHFVCFAHSTTRNHRHSRCPASLAASGGMKAHMGVDAQSGLVHTLVGTAANVHVAMLPSKRKGLSETAMGELMGKWEHAKAPHSR